jgi:hypothetical protein
LYSCIVRYVSKFKICLRRTFVAMVCYAVSHCHLLTYDRTEKSVNMWIFSIGKRTWIVNDVLISEVVDLVLYLLLVEQRIIKNGTFSMPPHQMTDKQFCHINSIVHNTLCCCGQCALFLVDLIVCNTPRCGIPHMIPTPICGIPYMRPS